VAYVFFVRELMKGNLHGCGAPWPSGLAHALDPDHSYRTTVISSSVYGSFFSSKGNTDMESAGVGWIAAIIIGGIAGWLAEKFMNSSMGLLMNILLGIVGAIVANAILSVFGVVLGGWLGYLIAGFVGACVLIAVGRVIRR
jgi:uncharacterized membrane protein YeaQ/YmgE (transglycosylase-associated protein family)